MPAPLYRSAPPDSVFASSSSSEPSSQYENLYRSLLGPLNLYLNEPLQYVPLGSPRGRGRLDPNYAAYERHMRTHEAYIAPGADNSLPAVTSRLRALLENNAPVGHTEQRKSSPILGCSPRSVRVRAH